MRVALLGVGHWHAGFHAEAATSSGAEIGAVWDEDAAVATAFAARAGGHAVPTPQAAMAERPDLAVVLGRGPAAAGLLGTLLDHDIPLLVDKPLRPNADDVPPVAERAARLGRFVTVALANRVGPIPAEIATLRAAGTLGAISHTQLRSINGPPQRYRDWGVGWMLDPRQSGRCP